MTKATYVTALISMNFLWQVVHAGIYEDYSRLLSMHISDNETNTTLNPKMMGKPDKPTDKMEKKSGMCRLKNRSHDWYKRKIMHQAFRLRRRSNKVC
jgi:hypothetical protein